MIKNALLGNTPVVRLEHLIESNVYAKLEYYNPTFSVKDRAAYNMVTEAINRKKIKKGDTLIEATSGNTGLGICYAAIQYGLNVICTVFDDVPIEKINLLKGFGATVIVCPSSYESSSPQGYVGVAKRIASEMENCYYVDQFNNYDNVMAHYKYTGPELYEQMNKKIDYLFATIGTGGTISGLGKYLKEKNNNIKIIGVEPVGGIYKKYFYGKALHYTDHLIQSISDDFISNNFYKEYVDEVIQVEDVDSFSMCYEILRTEGLSIGTSGGCVVAAVKKYCNKNNIEEDKNIVCIIPDCGLKYMDTLFNQEYLNKHNLQECSKKQIDDLKLKEYIYANGYDVTIV